MSDCLEKFLWRAGAARRIPKCLTESYPSQAAARSPKILHSPQGYCSASGLTSGEMPVPPGLGVIRESQEVKSLGRGIASGRGKKFPHPETQTPAWDMTETPVDGKLTRINPLYLA